MFPAYNKLYQSCAQQVMARMLDFATHDLGFNLSFFYDLFLTSNVSSSFETGDYEILTGQSGIELAYLVLDQTGCQYERVTPKFTSNRSEEYWTGWALAYYQWRTSLTFEEINRAVPINSVRNMYTPFHEMDIRQFCDVMDDHYRDANPDTNLKRLRLEAGLSQSHLANASGVPLRTIQQYEQRNLNINKAAVETIFQLARILQTPAESLMEKVPPITST